jgi:uncharacterized protein (UPF0548 family)
MLALRTPRPDALDRILAAQERRPLSYSQVGWSLTARAPEGAFINEARSLLGAGQETYEKARAALASWRMFPPWIRLHTREHRIEPGNVVLTVARYGLWAINACRVIYVHEERGDVDSLAIGYGTLDGHLMRGEERFRVSWRREDDAVWYDVWSFSWPHGWIARCALPAIRKIQRRFALESPAAMKVATLEA